VHEVVATATDADGHASSFAWDINVHQPDVDGDGWSSLLDCDETDAAVHPGATEYLGNGIDDDCDDSSPDAPPGGLTGKVYGWGNATYGALGTGTISNSDHVTPTATALDNDVVQVEAMLGNAYAVLADGSVRAWGISGAIGDGQSVTRYGPVQPVGPGGVGLLTGVRRISASLDHVAALPGLRAYVARRLGAHRGALRGGRSRGGLRPDGGRHGDGVGLGLLPGVVEWRRDAVPQHHPRAHRHQADLHVSGGHAVPPQGRHRAVVRWHRRGARS
jgi:hypothetical protein